MSEEVLTTRRLNRALLARQLLLERSGLSIPEALEALAGIQNQYAPNAYIRLWSCLTGFAREELTRAYEASSVVQGTLMRGTTHTVSAADHGPFAAAVREPLRQWARSAYRVDDSDREAVVRRVHSALRGRSVRRAELLELRGSASAASWATIDVDAELIRVPPSGTWERRRADIYALAEDRVPARVPHPAPIEHLVRRYLGGFGPARVHDIASFAGMPVTMVKTPVASMGDLARFRDESGRELVDIPGAPLPPEDVRAPVRFLPTWDATLLVHARRTLILPEAYRPLIFHTKMPPSYPTFLVDGAVAGTWRFAEGEIVTTPFRALAASEQADVDAEAHRLALFHA